MIQQQFKDMHRKIDHARKHVDNEPPMASMFKRAHFNNFAVDYRERVKERPMVHVRPRVDSREPDSFHLIANLYINRQTRSQYASPVVKATASALDPEPNGRVTYATRPRPLSARATAASHSASGHCTRAVLREAATDRAAEDYALSIANRLDDIARHRDALQNRRLLRRQQEAAAFAATMESPTRSDASGIATDPLKDAAQSALESISRRGRTSDHRTHSEEVEPEASPLKERYEMGSVLRPPLLAKDYNSTEKSLPADRNIAASQPAGFKVPTPPTRPAVFPSAGHHRPVSQHFPTPPAASEGFKTVLRPGRDEHTAPESRADQRYSQLRFPSTLNSSPHDVTEDALADHTPMDRDDFIEPYEDADDDVF
jgi:hypothetical protein